jgi:hypothetical protein
MRRRFIVKKGLIVGLMVLMTMVAAPSVQAISYDFTSDHCTDGCGTSPFGFVQLLQNGGTVDVTVHLNSPNEFVKTAAADEQAFKFNAIDVVLGDITIDPHTPSLAAATGSFNGDGTGNFAFGINAPTQGPGGSDPFSSDIVFHVADAVIADLTAPNNLGIIFVADIIGSTGNTGPVDVTGVTVPEPAAMLLLGISLVGLWGARRKLKK